MARLEKYQQFNVDDALEGFKYITSENESNESYHLCAAYTYFTLGFGLLGYNEETKAAAADVLNNEKGELKGAWNWNDRPYGDAWIGSAEDIGGDKWTYFNNKMSEYGYALLCKEFICLSPADNPSKAGYPMGYQPQDGDICAMCSYSEIDGKYVRNLSGSFHMCIYLKGSWYSDFKQSRMMPYESDNYYPMVYSIWRVCNDGEEIKTINGNKFGKISMDDLVELLPEEYRNEFNEIPDSRVKKPSSCGGRAEKLLETLMSHGLNSYQSFALTACTMQETGCDHTLRNDLEYNGKGANGTEGWNCGEGLVQFTFWETKKPLIVELNNVRETEVLTENETEYMKDSSAHIVDLDLDDATFITEFFYRNIINKTKDYTNYVDVCAEFYLQKAGAGGSAKNYTTPFDKAYYRADDYVKTHTRQNPGNTYYNGFLSLLKMMFYLILSSSGGYISSEYEESGGNASSDSSGDVIVSKRRPKETGYVVKKNPSTSALNGYNPTGNYSDSEKGRENRLKDFFLMANKLGNAYGGGRDIMCVKSEEYLVDTTLIKSDDQISKIESKSVKTSVRKRK